MSAQGCQLPRTEPMPASRKDRVKLSVTAAVRPKMTPAAVASRPARRAPLLTIPAPAARAAMSATTLNANTQSQAGASDRPDDGGEVARKDATPPATSP